MEGIYLNQWTIGILGALGTLGTGVISALFKLWVTEKEKRIDELRQSVVLLSDVNKSHDKLISLSGQIGGMISKDEKADLRRLGEKLVDRIESLSNTIDRTGIK